MSLPEGYSYTGEFFEKDEDDLVYETAENGVCWLYKEGEAHLVVTDRFPDAWLGIYSSGHLPLGAQLKRMPAEIVARKMLLPGEYLKAGDWVYVLEDRTKVPGQGPAGSDSHESMDDIVKGIGGIRQTILNGRFNETVKEARGAIKAVAHVTYRTLYLLRELFGSEWEDRHQEEFRRWGQLSDDFYTGEEAGLLAIELAEAAVGNTDDNTEENV